MGERYRGFAMDLVGTSGGAVELEQQNERRMREEQEPSQNVLRWNMSNFCSHFSDGLPLQRVVSEVNKRVFG